MARARHTTDHDEIRDWVEHNGGHPAQVAGTGGMLRIDFGRREERLEPIEWNRFFDLFDQSHVEFVYDPSGHFNKFVERGANGTGSRSTVRAARKTTGSRKSSSPRGTRKKSSSSRKKTTRKKTTSRKSSGARAPARKTARKSTRGSTAKKSTGRKYSKKSQQKVQRVMREMKRGELKSGRSGKKVRSRKQAIAIGLSEARRSGAKVPPKPSGRKKR